MSHGDRDTPFPGPVLDVLAARPDRPVLEHGARVVTAGELLATVGRLAGGLRAAGLGPGRSLALTTGVTPEAFAANLAAHARGCLVVGLRPGWTRPQLAEVLGRRFDALLGDPSTLTAELRALAGPARVLSLGAVPGAPDVLAGPGGPGGSNGSGGGPGDRGPVPVLAAPDDPARVIFTSGSTGRPKSCVRSYRTFGRAYRPDRWAPGLAAFMARGERLLVYNSLSIPVMLTFAGRCLLAGGTVVLAEPDPRPDLAAAVARHRASAVVLIVPTLQRMLARLRDAGPGRDVDLSGLRAVMVTGSPASPALLRSAVDRLGPIVWQGYGQAESGMISLLTPDDVARHPDAALASVGRPLPEVEVEVRDGEGRPVGPGGTGEIHVRSPHVMDGYWDDPEGTREVLAAGWLRTRDLGRLDPVTGLLHLTGRTRDVIIVNAEVCYAGAVEAALARDPSVEQAYAVGVPDQQTGEAVHAFVVPAAGGSAPDPDALRRRVGAELSPNHVPRTVTVIAEVPVAPGGKPDKRALAALVPEQAGVSLGSVNVPHHRLRARAPTDAAQEPKLR